MMNFGEKTSYFFSLAEKAVPVPAVSKVFPALLFEPRLKRKEDGCLSSLPTILSRQVAVRQDHVLHRRREVPENLGPEVI